MQKKIFLNTTTLNERSESKPAAKFDIRHLILVSYLNDDFRNVFSQSTRSNIVNHSKKIQ